MSTNKRIRTGSVSPNSKQPNKTKAIEYVDKEPRFFSGPYSEFIQVGPWIYRLRKYRAIQAVMEALKPHFGLYHTRYKVDTIDGVKYLCYSTFKNKDKGKVLDVIPYNLVWEFDFGEQFQSELRAVYFFRFLMGFKTEKKSLEVTFDGTRYHPISARENAFCRKPCYGMSDYRISNIDADSDVEDQPTNILWISPSVETRKFLGTLSLGKLHDFISKLRDTLREIDPKYVYIANSVRETLLSLVEFD